MTSWLIDLAIVAVLALLGLQLAHWIAPNEDRVLHWSIAFPLGAGVYAWSVFCLGWAGLKIASPMMAAVAATLLITSTALRWQQSPSRGAGGIWQPGRPTGVIWPLWVALGGLLLAALALSVGRAYSAYDAAAGWAVKGYGLAREGTLAAGQEWGLFGLGYPMNIMLQIATFAAFDDDTLPGSKLIFPLYLASVCLGCYRFWTKHGVPQGPASLAVAFLATNPVAFLHATNGYANLPFAAILTLGLLHSLEGILRGQGRIQALGGLLLGLAAWTRPEGIGYFAALVLGFILLRVLRRIGTVRWIAWLAPGASIAMVWSAFAWRAVMQTHLGETIQAVPSGLTAGDLHLNQLILIPRLFITRSFAPENWGLFLPVVLALFVLGLAGRRPWRRGAMLPLVVLSVIVAALPVLIYYARSFAPSADFQAVLRRDFDRAFLPGFFLLSATAVLAGAGGEAAHEAGQEQPPAQAALDSRAAA